MAKLARSFGAILLILALILSVTTAYAKVIATCGKGFLEEKQGLKVLHVRGNPYEIGYQHGMLLGKHIQEACYMKIMGVSLSAGGGDFDKGFAKMVQTKNLIEPYIPPQYKEEIRGISDGAKSAGYPIDYEDLLIYNTYTDAYAAHACSVCVPPDTDLTKSSPSKQFPGCDSFSAWGKATADGKLISGGNLDWLVVTTPSGLNSLICPTVMVAEPDSGYAFIAPIWPGIIMMFGGLNEAHVTVQQQTSGSTHATLAGLGEHFQERLVLQYAGSIDDALTLFTYQPLTRGMNYHVVDAKANKAATIEVNAHEIAIRYGPGDDTLNTSNHYNCYPGWQGYSGRNMIEGQAPAYGFEDISTIEKWQESLHKAVPWTAYRFDRYRELINQNYGRITIGKAIEFVSDHYDMVNDRKLDWNEEQPVQIIASWAPKVLAGENVPIYKMNRTEDVYTQCCPTTDSHVAVPADLDIWIAMMGPGRPEPAQHAGFVYFNLKEELNKRP